MTTKKIIKLVSLLFILGVLLGSTVYGNVDLVGMWYGTWQSSLIFGQTGNLSMSVFQNEGVLYGMLNVPDLGLFDTTLPITVDGNSITIGVPDVLLLEATLDGEKISGIFNLPLTDPPYVDNIDWQLTKYRTVPPRPDLLDPLPPLFCPGSAEYSSQLVSFEPVEGQGYLDYPVGDETWDNQYHSYLRRDLMYLIKYATAKVARKTATWDYGNVEPLGLGDMSEANGAIPGTSTGFPQHPEGTHTDGCDIDTAYYQLYAPDNLLRAICDYTDGETIVYNCVDEPYALDKWRTALFLAYLSEHPRLRVIGVDGKVGPILQNTLDELAGSGFIASSLRARIPLTYEITDIGRGWYSFHYGHLHISMKPLYSILSEMSIVSDGKDEDNQGAYITAYIELVEGYDADDIDIHSVALMLDGHNLIYSLHWHSELTDFNSNGVQDLAVKFETEHVLRKLQPGSVEITLMGSIHDQFFQGTDTITVAE
jgi:hypothetical protein